jgi:hypothetical protein
VITAETITDEQIRDIRRNALVTSPRFVDEDRVIRAATNALGESRWFAGVDCRIPHGHEARYVREAWARCAEILNAQESRRCPKCGALCDHAAWDGIHCPWCRS